jgi:hypothetical protein
MTFILLDLYMRGRRREVSARGKMGDQEGAYIAQQS